MFKQILKEKLVLGIAVAIWLGWTSVAHAHFVWVYQEAGKIRVVFGEGLEPGQAKFLGGLDSMRGTTWLNSDRVNVEFSKQTEGEEGWFDVDARKVGRSVLAECPYGVITRGDKSILLNYTARYSRLDVQTGLESLDLGPTLDLKPAIVDGKLQLASFFAGKPVEDVEVLIESIDWEPIGELRTDRKGLVALPAAKRFVVRAKHVVEEAGEVDGKPYSSRSYYCTMVLDIDPSLGAANVGTQTLKRKKAESVNLTKIESRYPDFPRSMTSFGATVVGGKAYVIGGKSGRAHAYAKSYQNRDVFCLDLDADKPEWKSVGNNLGLQGLAIVGYGGKVYRIGGLEARNKEGDEQDLHSTDSFVCFDPATGEWADMPSLPAGRSSFDACVVGDSVYVVGGWEMSGDSDPVWSTDMLRFDFKKPSQGWVRSEVPFRTRAMMVCALDNKLYVVGGIVEDGGPTNEVHVFDIKEKNWSTGPEVPAEGDMQAFGCAAIAIEGQLFVGSHDGGIYRLRSDGWDKSLQLENGRFFHQMLPVGKNRFGLFGGSHMGQGSQNRIEVFEIESNPSTENATGVAVGK